jgi:hypothetical protein
MTQDFTFGTRRTLSAYVLLEPLPMCGPMSFAHGQDQPDQPDQGARGHPPNKHRGNERIAPSSRTSPGGQRQGHWPGRWPQLAGIGVLVAALVVLLWPGALPYLAVAALLLGLTLLCGLLVALYLHRHTP